HPTVLDVRVQTSQNFRAPFFLVSGCCMTVALYPGTLIQKGGRSSYWSAAFCIIQILLTDSAV
ncbi:hypothetical protein, partial [Faecalibaculum rodentium]|uniref:hypothetical protein n=1 Tax=Faecalibaculum rodentium TaxID=1702221 RepID=UPI0023F3F379